jgi:peptide/nickel transport system permease protein
VKVPVPDENSALPVAREAEGLQPARREIPFLETTKKLFRQPLAAFGFVIIFITVICAIFPTQIAPHDPDKQYLGHYMEPPSRTFLLGTDQLGRDTLSRVIYGARVALIISVGAVGLGVAIGTPIGLVSAYVRGWIDELLMRIMDAIVSFPSLIIAIALVAVLGGSLINVIIAIGVANIPWIARVVRSQALSIRERDFVTAARAVGAKDRRIIAVHLWPNSTAPVIVQGTLGMAYAILTEAGLGFLGLSVPPPTPTWGNMLQYAFPLLDRAPLLSIVPGMAIFLLVLAFNFVGDALRDVLDPRLRGLFT